MKRKIIISLLLIGVTLSVSCMVTSLEFSDVTLQMEQLHASPDEVEQISATFYRNLLPAVVSTMTSVVLLIMLGYFIIFNYIRPLEKMKKSIDFYNSFSKDYTLEIKGNDTLSKLNEAISQLVKDNMALQARLAALKSTEPQPEKPKDDGATLF